MGEIKKDKRLLEMACSKGMLSEADLAKQLTDLPDLADNVAMPEDKELDELKKELVAEHEARVERIERFLSEPKEPAPPPAPLIPIDADA